MSSTRAPGPRLHDASPAELSGPALSRFVWEAKYRNGEERSPRDSWRRIARALASVEAEPGDWTPRFEAVLKGFRFLPGGRIQAGAGQDGAVLFNCFVLPGPSQSVQRSLEALADTVATLRAGGGVGCDFSAAPPKGWPAIDGPPAPGPVAYLELWDEACRTFLAQSARQGAMMGVLRCDHPDVEAFAAAKQAPGSLSRFNLSVGVTDAFMTAVEADADWSLRHPDEGAPVRTLRARRLWEHILRCAYDSGEPGVLFLDRINAANNLGWRERIAATNPCGEVPLPEYGACDLGSLNLAAFVRHPFTAHAALDLDALADTAAVAVRMLDDALDLSAFPLAAQASTVRASRRIGLGLTGLADALVMLGARYGSPASLALGRRILRTIRDAAYGSSIALAREKGAFPAFQSEPYLESEFVRRLPVRLRQLIADHGIRNSHLLAIAPTGSISLLAGGVSTGIEPIFAGVQLRTVRTAGGGSRTIRTLDPALALWRGRGVAGEPPGFVTARELSFEAHLAMQAALQPFVDNAISKTVNVAADLSFEAFRSLFERAYARGLKGCTAFRATREAVLREGGGTCVAP